MVPVIRDYWKIFLPFYSRLKVTSAYEYLGMRFGNGTRSFASLLYHSAGPRQNRFVFDVALILWSRF